MNRNYKFTLVYTAVVLIISTTVGWAEGIIKDSHQLIQWIISFVLVYLAVMALAMVWQTTRKEK